MGKIHKLSDREKELLNVLGNHPEISIKELVNYTNYKRESSVGRKLHQLREQRILDGPLYDLNYSKLCKNPLHKMFCIIETDNNQEIVIAYLKLIEPLRLVLSVLSHHKKVLVAVFYSSDDVEMKALLQLLKDNNIITDYLIRVWCSKRMVENPNFFGDYNPSLDNLLSPRDIPDMSLKCHDTCWNECDIAIIPYLRFNDTKLIEILRKEKNLHRSWTYEQVRYSREKMLKHGLIRKDYSIYPFSPDQCIRFGLFLITEDTALMQRILYNFARGARVYKEYVLCEDEGWVYCVCHPSFLKDLMRKLDQVEEIKEEEIYLIRTGSGKYHFARYPVLKYFDFDEQTLKYPYHEYREKIKQKLEND